jgi:cell volume regulation protein A
MPTALNEPHATALLLVVFGALMAFCVLFTRTLDRAGVPVVLIFLILGMLGGSEGLGGVAFDNYAVAFRLGTIALILILFDGGLNTSWYAIRRSAAPAGILATVGVAGTAGLLAVIGRLFGLPWTEAILIGVIVSSTDAAAVFAVLRGGSIRMKERVGNTIEVESCINDPMAVILTVAAIEAVRGGSFSVSSLLISVPLQLVIGGVVGVAVGYGTRVLLGRTSFNTGGLYPVVTLASAFIAFGAGTVANGSGFLAVFAAAAVLGNGPLPYKSGLARVHDSIAWMCQVSMFLMLGLLVFPSKLTNVALVGLCLGLALAFIARPLIVTLCLLPFRWPFKEIACVGWVGLRGAVPIILATFPVMAGIDGSDRIFHIVFFIVVVSALVPGASILPLTRYLKLNVPLPPAPAAGLEMHSLRRLDGDIRVFFIDDSVAVCNARLSEVNFPDGSAAILVVRGDHLLAARGNTELKAGDFVYVFCRKEHDPYLGLLFGKPTDE